MPWLNLLFRVLLCCESTLKQNANGRPLRSIPDCLTTRNWLEIMVLGQFDLIADVATAVPSR
jgi:hypothetical protein